MSNKRVITISIRADGSELREVAQNVEELQNGLSELDVMQAREALESLNGVDLSAIKSSIQSIGSRLNEVGGQISGFGQKLTLSLTAPIAAVAALGVKFNATKEQATTAFRVLLKNGEAAKKLYSELQDFADSTPFETPEVVESGRKLLAAKVPLIEIKGYLTDIGDLAAGTGQNITDVASAFTRIKAGDFGEAFERLRDFGIARKDLEAEGLTFDKGGQYLGSVEAAMKAVRAIVQRDFGGMMDEQSKTFSGRLSTLWDTINRGLGDLFEPLFNQISAGLPLVIGFVTKIKDFFGGLSEPAKIAVTAFLGITAAVGPVLIVVGSLISFFAPIITGLLSLGAGISAAGGVIAFLGTTLATVGTIVTSVIIPALISLAPIILGVVAVFTVVAAAAVALYAAWTTNFGGLKDYTVETWTLIKSVVQTGMAFVYSVVQSVGGQIVGWWRENYPLIRQIIQTVSNSIKATVGAFLDAVRGFWKEHGAAISSYVQTYWSYIKSVISQVVDQIGSLIRFGLQLINGDWSGAWQTLLQIIQNGAKLAVTIWRGFLDTLGKLLAAIIPIAVEYGTKFGITLAAWIGKAVVGAVYIIATLPQRIIETVPKLIRAGMSIGSAIWKGIKEGLAGSAETLPTAVELSAQNTFTQKPIDYSRPQDLPQKDQIKQVASLDTGKLKDDAEKLKREREALAKSELSAQINLYQNQISEVEKNYKDSFGKISETFKETNNPQQFQASFDQLKAWYGEQINTLAPAWEELVKTQTLAEKKGQFEQYAVYQDTQKRKQELNQNTFDLEAKANQLIKESQKQLSEQQIKDAKEKFELNAKLAQSSKELSFAEIDAQDGSLARLKEFYDTKLALDNTDLASVQGAQQVERAYLVEVQNRKLQMLQVEVGLRQQIYDLVKNTADGKSAGIDLTTAKNAVKTLEAQNKTELFKFDEATKRTNEQKSAEQLNTYQKALEDLNGKLATNTELTEYAKVQNLLLTDSYKNLSDVRKADLLNTAAQVDAQKTYNEQYSKTYDFIRGSLDILTDKGKSFGDKMKTIFGGIADKFKSMLLDMTANFLTSKLFGGASGGASGSGSSGGGGIFDTIKNLFGGGQQSSGGSILSQSGAGRAFSSGGGVSPTGTINAAGEFVVNGNQSSGGGSSILSTLKNLFSTKEGGLFAAKQNILTGKDSKMGGIASGVGAIASLVGGFLPGKLGSVVSSAGMGIQIGAMFGPWGALAGGIIGGIAGLFGGDPKRKADKKENLPKLQQGFTDALQQLRELAANKNQILSDPDGVIAKANELKGQIASGFGIQFQSKKYRKQATAQIAAKVGEADSIIAGIREFAKKSYSMKELEGHIVGEFASGVYMDRAFASQYVDFKRRNGMMPGAFTGRDTLPSMIAAGEMVLNPRQIASVIQATGYDPFQFAGVPNYPSKPQPVRGYADGNYFGTSSAPTGGALSGSSQGIGNQSGGGGDIYIYLTPETKIDAEGMVTYQIKTSSNTQRAIKVVVEDKFANDELKLRKRQG